MLSGFSVRLKLNFDRWDENINFGWYCVNFKKNSGSQGSNMMKMLVYLLLYSRILRVLVSYVK